MSEYRYRVRLFYSYCHKDEDFREKMETSLALLRDNAGLTEWSDRKITPGSKLRPIILKKLEQADIVVYLVSLDFLDSPACKEEWRRAKIHAEESGQILIPIVIRPCPWRDFDNMETHLAIPQDGRAVTKWENEDEAWTEVYGYIKTVLDSIRRTFEVKEPFRRTIGKVEFISKNQENIRLEDLFVFPNLVLESKASFELPEKRVADFDEFLKVTHALLTGEDLSGKTTVCRKLFLHLVENNHPVLLVDLEEVGTMTSIPDFCHEMYAKQLKGDYELWEKRSNKTIILDNLTSNRIDFLTYAQEHFDRVYVAISNDNYVSFFADDPRLAHFRQIKVLPTRHSSQEQLIRKWTQLDPELKFGQKQLSDGRVDQLEKVVNSVMLGRVVPRFPFFILSILQTHEGYLPPDLKITAYGHCYHALIVAHLFDSGIEKEQIDSCFNFLSELAYKIRLSPGEQNSLSMQEFELFEEQYRKEFIDIRNSTRSRLFDQPNSLLSVRHEMVCFSWSYSYYFFLGLYLSGHYKENEDLIHFIMENSYVRDNSLTLIFIIHHSQNPEVIDDVLIHAMDTFDWQEPARLDLNEITVFEDILRQLSVNYPSDNSHVSAGRTKERNQRDVTEPSAYDGVDQKSPQEIVNDTYRTLKNMDILSQVLKNKHGSIEKERLVEIIETVVDTGLKLARTFLFDESELDMLTKFVKEKLEEYNGTKNLNEDSIKTELTRLIFQFVMFCVGKAVSSIDSKDISQVVKSLCEQKNTPAYDLVYSFYSIGTADNLSDRQVDIIRQTLKKHRKNYLITRALPLRIQTYLTTHRVSHPIRSTLKSMLRLLAD